MPWRGKAGADGLGGQNEAPVPAGQVPSVPQPRGPAAQLATLAGASFAQACAASQMLRRASTRADPGACGPRRLPQAANPAGPGLVGASAGVRARMASALVYRHQVKSWKDTAGTRF